MPIWRYIFQYRKLSGTIFRRRGRQEGVYYTRYLSHMLFVLSRLQCYPRITVSSIDITGMQYHLFYPNLFSCNKMNSKVWHTCRDTAVVVSGQLAVVSGVLPESDKSWSQIWESHEGFETSLKILICQRSIWSGVEHTDSRFSTKTMTDTLLER